MNPKKSMETQITPMTRNGMPEARKGRNAGRPAHSTVIVGIAYLLEKLGRENVRVHGRRIARAGGVAEVTEVIEGKGSACARRRRYTKRRSATGKMNETLVRRASALHEHEISGVRDRGHHRRRVRL